MQKSTMPWYYKSKSRLLAVLKLWSLLERGHANDVVPPFSSGASYIMRQETWIQCHLVGPSSCLSAFIGWLTSDDFGWWFFVNYNSQSYRGRATLLLTLCLRHKWPFSKLNKIKWIVLFGTNLFHFVRQTKSDWNYFCSLNWFW